MINKIELWCAAQLTQYRPRLWRLEMQVPVWKCLHKLVKYWIDDNLVKFNRRLNKIRGFREICKGKEHLDMEIRIMLIYNTLFDRGANDPHEVADQAEFQVGLLWDADYLVNQYEQFGAWAARENINVLRLPVWTKQLEESLWFAELYNNWAAAMAAKYDLLISYDQTIRTKNKRDDVIGFMAMRMKMDLSGVLFLDGHTINDPFLFNHYPDPAGERWPIHRAGKVQRILAWLPIPEDAAGHVRRYSI